MFCRKKLAEYVCKTISYSFVYECALESLTTYQLM